jgi:hypothetical protein
MTIATDPQVAAIRREALRRFVLDRFDGKRAALARACLVHSNQLNLMLTDNESIRRPMTDAIARRMEANLSLPPGFFDIPPADSGGVRVSAPQAIPEVVAPLFDVCDSPRSMLVSERWATRRSVTYRDGLSLVRVVSEEMAPLYAPGDVIVIENYVTSEGEPLVAEPPRDGTYVLIDKKGELFFRNVQRKLNSGWILTTANRALTPMELSGFKGITVFARVVAKLTFT